jgi:hypothetical protein
LGKAVQIDLESPLISQRKRNVGHFAAPIVENDFSGGYIASSGIVAARWYHDAYALHCRLLPQALQKSIGRCAQPRFAKTEVHIHHRSQIMVHNILRRQQYSIRCVG